MRYNNYSDVWEEDKEWSAKNFKLCEPIILKLLDLKQILSIENYSANETIKQLLDQNVGTDYIGIKTNGYSTVGIANRIQWSHPIYEEAPFNPPSKQYWYPKQFENYFDGNGFQTFTIRKERESKRTTEYQKRLIAIENNYDFPVFTIQSYISYRENGKLLSTGIIKTRDLITFVKNGKEHKSFEIIDVSERGKAKVYVVKWSHLINYFRLYIWPSNLIKKSPQQHILSFVQSKSNQEV